MEKPTTRFNPLGWIKSPKMIQEISDLFNKIDGWEWDKKTIDGYRKLMEMCDVKLNGKDYCDSPAHFIDTNYKYASVLQAKFLYFLSEKKAPVHEIIEALFSEEHRAFIMNAYLQAGEKRFHIHSDLVKMLQDTDIPRDAHSDDLRLPFEGIRIHFGKGSIKEWKNKEYIFACEATGVHTEEQYLELARRKIAVLSRELNEEILTKFIEIFVNERTLASSTSSLGVRTIWTFYAGNNDDFAPSGVLHLPENTPIEKFIPPDVDDITKQSLRLLTNLLLYINSPDSDVIRDTANQERLKTKLQQTQPGTRKHKVFQQQLRKSQNSYIYIVGKNIVADEFYHHEKKASAETREIMVRFRVRGHWRNQVCGPERMERKRIWIRPFWKGPSLSDLINKKYVVKQPHASN